MSLIFDFCYGTLLPPVDTFWQLNVGRRDEGNALFPWPELFAPVSARLVETVHNLHEFVVQQVAPLVQLELERLEAQVEELVVLGHLVGVIYENLHAKLFLDVAAVALVVHQLEQTNNVCVYECYGMCVPQKILNNFIREREEVNVHSLWCSNMKRHVLTNMLRLSYV